MNRKLIHGLIPIVVVVAAATFGAIVSAQSTSSAKKAERTTRAPVPAPDVQLTDVADRKPLSFYVSSVKGDLFAPELPPPPKVVAPKPAPIITTPPAPVNPLADYAYTGTVELNGQKMALVENIKTKEGQYLKEGDGFMGGTVSRVDDRTVAVMVAKTEQTMAKRDDFALTPLDKNAPFLNGPQPAAGAQPGQTPAAPQPGMGGMGMGGNRADWMQRFQNMTPEQRQAIQTRMLNRGFERGGRGGGGGGRGGNGGGGRRGGGGGMDFFGGG